MLFLLFLFTALFAAVEGKHLIRNRSWKEALLGAVLILIAAAYGTEIILESNRLPNPGVLFEKVQPLLKTYNDYFHLG